MNLAYELQSYGGRVGLLDLDLYGPSLPILVKPLDTTIRRSPLGKGMVYPIQHEGVKVLSLGYVNQEVRLFLLASCKSAGLVIVLGVLDKSLFIMPFSIVAFFPLSSFFGMDQFQTNAVCTC